MDKCDDINGLIEEYRFLLKKPVSKMSGPSKLAVSKIKESLICKGEWSPEASEHLLDLAVDYGSFMLRNALALSLALQIEDGELGF